jgi:hypothetical protein
MATAGQFKLNTEAARNIVGSEDATATALHSILLALYGEALYGEEPMDPLEIYADLEERFNITVPEDNENRINAIIMAVSSNAFYEDETAFVAIAESLLDGDLGDVPTGEMGGLSTLELLWAIYEVAVNRDENVPPFAPAIARMIETIANDEAQEDNDEIPSDVQDVEFLREKRAQVLQQLQSLWGEFPFESEVPDPVEILRPVI